MTGFGQAVALMMTALVALVLPVVVAPSPAQACLCVREPLGELVRDADAVFVGRLTEVRRSDHVRSFEYTFSVRRRYAGRVAWTTEVVTAADSSVCGLVGLREGERYVVLARAVSGTDEEGPWAANSCDGTGAAGGDLRGTVERLLGPGRRPTTPGARDSHPPAQLVWPGGELAVLVGGLAAGALVAFGGVLLARRRLHRTR